MKAPLLRLPAFPAWGQDIHAGLKLGVPMTQCSKTASPGRRHPTLHVRNRGEWRLTNEFGFELDALYHRMGYVGIVNYAGGVFAIDIGILF